MPQSPISTLKHPPPHRPNVFHHHHHHHHHQYRHHHHHHPRQHIHRPFHRRPLPIRRHDLRAILLFRLIRDLLRILLLFSFLLTSCCASASSSPDGLRQGGLGLNQDLDQDKYVTYLATLFSPLPPTVSECVWKCKVFLFCFVSCSLLCFHSFRSSNSASVWRCLYKNCLLRMHFPSTILPLKVFFLLGLDRWVKWLRTVQQRTELEKLSGISWEFLLKMTGMSIPGS